MHFRPSSLLAAAAAICFGIKGAVAQGGSGTLTNPVIWEDYPDLDVFRVGDVFYYSSSTFAYSPGAPILKSYDLANWTPVSHSVPELSFGPQYNLGSGGGRAYVEGIWASSLRYRPSNDTFFWIGCIQGGNTYVWSSPGQDAAANDGEVSEWQWAPYATLNTCYYDCGLLFDDDDTPYVAYGARQIRVAQLSPDGKREVANRVIFDSGGTLVEGSRMYKINGMYYVLVTRPANEEWVLRSSSPFGPYERRTLVANIAGPLTMAGYAHQGGIVETKDNEWYYAGFLDAYPGGRIPVVAPITWNDGWPELVTGPGRSWGTNYPIPVETNKTVLSTYGTTDYFSGPTLSHEWEWNHNPENSKWSFGDDGGLTLQTVDATKDLYAARNTLTHRVVGPKSNGVFRLDVSGMQNGDRAGMALFRDDMAYIAVFKGEGGESRIVMFNDIRLANSNGKWRTASEGRVGEQGPVLAGSEVWFKVEADVTPAFGSNIQRQATFWYSLDGQVYTRLGPPLSLSNSYTYFMGYRYAVFNHATTSLGGEVKVKEFTMNLI